MSVPAEMYGFGTQYAMIIAVFLAIPFAMNNIILPIFYSNNITNCYSVNRQTTGILMHTIRLKLIIT